MQTDCILIKSCNGVENAVRSAIEKKQDILPVTDNNGVLSGIIYSVILNRLEEIDLKDRTGLISLIDTDFTGVMPDASMEQIAALLKGNARPVRSIIVHDNQRRFLGIIPPNIVMPQTEHNRGRSANHY